jgi:hypothetical protein
MPIQRIIQMIDKSPRKNFEAILSRVQSVRITPELAKRLLQPFTSSAIHEAERHALGFIGLSPEDSPANLLLWLEGNSINAHMARGMFDTFNREPNRPIYLTPSIYIAIGVASQVYVYGHHSSRIVVPDYRVADIRRIIADPEIVYGIDPYYFEEIVAFIYELMGLKVTTTKKSGALGVMPAHYTTCVMGFFYSAGSVAISFNQARPLFS